MLLTSALSLGGLAEGGLASSVAWHGGREGVAGEGEGGGGEAQGRACVSAVLWPPPAQHAPCLVAVRVSGCGCGGGGGLFACVVPRGDDKAACHVLDAPAGRGRAVACCSGRGEPPPREGTGTLARQVNATHHHPALRRTCRLSWGRACGRGTLGLAEGDTLHTQGVRVNNKDTNNSSGCGSRTRRRGNAFHIDDTIKTAAGGRGRLVVCAAPDMPAGTSGRVGEGGAPSLPRAGRHG